MEHGFAPASKTTCDQCQDSFPSGFYLEKSEDGVFRCEKCRAAQAPQARTLAPTAPPAPGHPTCPRCSNTAVRAPFVGWKGFQTSLVAYFMSLFTVNKLIETATRNANAPRPEDFIFNPFVQRTPRVYVPPDYSPLYIIGALGLCVIVFLFFSALNGHNVCEACGHRWKP